MRTSGLSLPGNLARPRPRARKTLGGDEGFLGMPSLRWEVLLADQNLSTVGAIGKLIGPQAKSWGHAEVEPGRGMDIHGVKQLLFEIQPAAASASGSRATSTNPFTTRTR